MEVKLVKQINELGAFKKEWNNLLEQNEVKEIFLTYEWIKTWLDIFYKNREIFFLFVKEKEKIIGIAPLVIYKDGKKRSLGFVGRRGSDYNDFIIPSNKKEILPVILDYIILNKDKFDLVELINIPHYSSTSEIFRTYSEKNHIKLNISIKNLCLTHLINKKSNLRFNKKKIRKARNSLSKLGTLSFECLYDIGHIKKHLPNFFSQHIKRKGAKSIFLQRIWKMFIEKLIDSLPLNSILFSVVKLDNKPIAYHCGFIYNNKLIWYLPTFNINYEKYSPGLILLREVYNFVSKGDIKEIDFTVGEESYKKRFSNKVGKNLEIKFFP